MGAHPYGRRARAVAQHRHGEPHVLAVGVVGEHGQRGRVVVGQLVLDLGWKHHPFDDEGRTLADLARDVGDCSVLVVSPPGLGSLNATALTVEALAHRDLRLLGVVVGRWPAEPDLACRANLDDLETLVAGPLAGVLADGIGELAPDAFLATAWHQLGPTLGGSFDAADFRRTHAARPEG